MFSMMEVVARSLNEPKSAVLADLWLLGNSVQLNVFNRVSQRSTASVTNCCITLHFNHRNSINLFFSITSEPSELGLLKIRITFFRFCS
jgi:hypothetical protein